MDVLNPQHYHGYADTKKGMNEDMKSIVIIETGNENDLSPMSVSTTSVLTANWKLLYYE